MLNPRNKARLGGKDFREFRDFKEFRERGMIQEPPSGLAGTGGRDRALGMAPPYRGPGYVTRWLSATGDTRRGGRLWIAIIAEVAIIEGRKDFREIKDFKDFKDFRDFRDFRGSREVWEGGGGERHGDIASRQCPRFRDDINVEKTKFSFVVPT